MCRAICRKKRYAPRNAFGRFPLRCPKMRQQVNARVDSLFALIRHLLIIRERSGEMVDEVRDRLFLRELTIGRVVDGGQAGREVLRA